MPPKFSKALLAAGLAAALVGCGGGSSTTPMADGMGEDMPPASDSTAAEEAAKKIQASYDTVKGLVDGLTVDSDAEQIKSVRAQANDLLSDIRTTTDLEDRSGFTTKANELLAAIAKVEADQKAAADELASETMRMNQRNAWKTALSTHSLDTIGTAWPTDVIGSRTGSTVGGLSDGWTGRNYEYPLSGLEEQGKTFMKNVTKVTQPLSVRWDTLANHQADNPADYLGANVKMAIAGLDLPTVTGSQAQVQIDLQPGEAGFGASANAVFTTKIHKDHLAAPNLQNIRDLSATILPGSASDKNNLINTNKHYSPARLTHTLTAIATPTIASGDSPTSTTAIDGFNDLLLADLFGRTGFFICSPNDVAGSCALSFDDDGFLQVGFSVAIPAGTAVAVNFIPFDRTADLNSHDIVYKKGATKTSATEFAYWVSEETDDDFTVTVNTFARGRDFDPVTTTPGELMGEARYTGLAAGYYAIGTESNGEFTAAATLTADFGDNTVSGMVDSFKSVTGGGDIGSWELALSDARFMDDTFSNTFAGGTEGGGGEGEWNGQFLGMANPGNDLVPDMTNDYPQAVVGNFRGHFANDGHAVGAFGADLD